MDKELTTPLSADVLTGLKSGDQISITGVLFTARDAAHRRMQEIIDRGGKLPVDFKGQVIYYVGPTPAQPGMATGSAGPTTSSRMNRYIPGLLRASGFKAIIGKGEIGEEAIAALKENGAIYLAAVGGAGALLAEKISSAEAVAWPELGAEAIYRFEVKQFPAIVVLDLHGGNLYRSGRLKYRQQG